MALVIAVLIAVFVVDPPLSYLVVAGGAAVELGESGLMLWYSRRRRAVVGVQALVGGRASVVRACRPDGQVRVQGEIWGARCAEGANVGDDVRVDSVEGLVLVVSRVAR